MGLLRSLDFGWIDVCGKKHCKNLFWKLRAAVKKAVKSGDKKRIRFQYDPSSYALNFDDGCWQIKDGEARKSFNDTVKVEDFPDYVNTATIVYVVSGLKPSDLSICLEI